MIGGALILILLVAGIIVLRTRSLADGYSVQPVSSGQNKSDTPSQDTSSLPIEPAPVFAQDTDGDGLSDEDEKRYGTDLNRGDSDGDGMSDSEELFFKKTDPLKADPRATRPLFRGDATSTTRP
jgi:hypothetical protein